MTHTASYPLLDLTANNWLPSHMYEILNFPTDFVPHLCSCQTCIFFSSYKSGKKHETTEFLKETICTIRTFIKIYLSWLLAANLYAKFSSLYKNVRSKSAGNKKNYAFQRSRWDEDQSHYTEGKNEVLNILVGIPVYA